MYIYVSLFGELFMSLKKFLMAGIVAAVLVACSGNRNSAARPAGDSSSITPQSSSSETSVSSSSVPEGYVDPSTVVTGTMTDERDGKTYKTVEIGTQTWMAENLNYAYTGVPYKSTKSTSDSTSWCYDNDAANCAKYGRLYTWAAAMDSLGKWSTNGKDCGYVETCSPTYPVRGICPEGWHLPTSAEFETLFTAVGGQSMAGKMLKSTSGWNSSGNGTDVYSFSALPAGRRLNNEDSYNEGKSAFFWSSTEYGSGYAYYMFLHYNIDDVNLGNLNEVGNLKKNFGHSVRCVKDVILGGSEVSSSSGMSVPSSSSLAGRTQCDVDTDENCLKDERDGQTYKTVKIGTQTWMAENLNYAVTGIPYKQEKNDKECTSDSTSWCYRNKPGNCTKYGRLYTWAAAMDSAGTWSTNSKGCGYGATCSPTYPVRGVCPEGWHLPTQTEWNTLFTAVGGDSVAGMMLKSTSGWNSSGNGTDAYAFSALPAGGRDRCGVFYNEGYSVTFWSSTEYNDALAFNVNLYYNRDNASMNAQHKYPGFSVRCLKD